MRQNVLGMQLVALGNLIRRALLENEEEHQGLTGMQRWVMGYLYRQTTPVFQKDIEKAFRLRGSTVTGILQLMEKKGYIRRETAAHDARLKSLHLTEKALQCCQACDIRIAKMDDILLSGFSEEEKQNLAYMLLHMEENIQQYETACAAAKHQRNEGEHCSKN